MWLGMVPRGLGVLVMTIWTFGVHSLYAAQPEGAVTNVRLENGLRVVLDSRDHDASVVTLMAYDAGSRRDPRWRIRRAVPVRSWWKSSGSEDP